MSTILASSPSPPRTWNLRPSGCGYIGIDIGAHAIQIAQLAQGQRRLRTLAQWQLPLAPEHRPDNPEGLRAALDQLGSQWPQLRAMFRGNRAAVTLPMHLLPLRTVEIPTGSADEMQTMVREELSDERGTSSPFTFACWESNPAEGGLTTMTAVAVDYEISQIVHTQLLRCGLECHVLDCLPCVLARAVTSAPQGPAGPGADAPYAILNFAGQTSQLYFCRAGQPNFCRTLNDSGLLQIHERLQARLQLSTFETELLLSEVGLSELCTATAAPSIGPLIAPTIDHIAAEVQRTLDYTSHRDAQQFPRRLWILGAGAEIRDLASYLAAALEIDVQVWQPGSAATAALGHPAVFAAAYSLSAAPLEAKPCK